MKRRWWGSSLVLAVILVLTACGGDDDGTEGEATDSEPTATQSEAPDETEAPGDTEEPASEETTAPDAAGSDVVTVGELGIIADAPTYIGMESGYFQEEGIEVELQRFRSAVDMVPLLSQGRLDAGAGTLSAGLYNALNRGLDITIVADNARVAPVADSHLALVIRPELEGEIQDYADLEGRSIAINAPAGGVEAELVQALEQGGLTLDDIDLQTIPFPDMTAALENGSIDAAITIEPFLTIGQANGSFVKFAGVGEFYPNHQIAVLLYSPDLAADSDLATRFLRAYMRGVRDFRTAFLDDETDQETRDAVVAALVEHTPVTDEGLYGQMAYQEVSADGMPNLDSIRMDLQYYMSSGEVEEDPGLDQYLNFDLLEEALQGLEG